MTPVIKKTIQLLVSMGFRNLKNEGSNVFIYTAGKVVDELKKIHSKIPGSSLTMRSDPKSSIGHVKTGSVNLYVKSDSQIINPVKNEKLKPVTNVKKKAKREPDFKMTSNLDSLYKFMKECLNKSKSCDFLFKAGSNQFKVSQCTGITFQNGIITLNASSKTIKIDLEPDVEIPDSFLKTEVQKVLDKAILELKTKLNSFRDYYTIEPPIAVKVSSSELDKIKKTDSSFKSRFGRSSIKVSDETIIIDASFLFKKEKASDMYFELTSEKDSDQIENYKGIKVSLKNGNNLDRKTVKVDRPRW